MNFLLFTLLLSLSLDVDVDVDVWEEISVENLEPILHLVVGNGEKDATWLSDERMSSS